MNKALFYKELRKRNSGVFGTSLSQRQVEGMEMLLAHCAEFGCDLGQTAYILATAYGESAHRMQPVRENMRYSAKRIAQVFGAHRLQGKSPQELAGNPQLLADTVYGGAWGRENLGNTEPNDGWELRGWGIAQITGRANLLKWAKGLGMSIAVYKGQMGSLRCSVLSLVQPMMEGWATGQSLPAYVLGPHRNYEGARAVWNGSFEAEKYAANARAFERALTAAGWSVDFGPKSKAKPKPKPKRGFFARLFGRGAA